MEIKQKQGDNWITLYPETTASNVILNEGNTVQDFVDGYEPSVRFGDGYSDTNDKPTVILQERMFIMTMSATMTHITQNKYHRLIVNLPFSNVERYNVNFTLTDGVGQTENIYVRQKNKDDFQLSTVAKTQFDDGYTVDVDIQVIGFLEQ